MGTSSEWLRFLEARDTEDAVSELRRMIDRLDESSHEVGGVLRTLSGSPSGEVEEVLRITRTTAYEAIALLNGVIIHLRLGPPDTAA